MVRLNSGLIGLIIANLLVATVGYFIEMPVGLEKMKVRISEIQQKLPDMREENAWIRKAEACLEAPPSADGNQCLTSWRTFGERIGIEFRESSNNGGEPTRLSFKGTGSYSNVSMFLNRVGSEKAALIKKLSINLVDKDLWELEVIIDVRRGPWKNAGIQREKPEFEETDFSVPILGTRNLYEVQRKKVVQPTIRERISYVGFFSGDKEPTLILEINGRSYLLKPGQKTPGGAVVKEADSEKVIFAQGAGKETLWTVNMKK